MSPEPGAPSPWGQPAPAYTGPAGAPARNGDAPAHAPADAPGHEGAYRARPGTWVGGTARVEPSTRPSGGRRLLRVIRSSTALVVIALSLGVAVAAGLGGLVWLIAAAIHHAAGN